MMKSSKPKVLNNSRLYAFTMKKMSNPFPVSGNYHKRLDKWRAAGIAVILAKFEMAPEDQRLHLHGIIHIPDSIYRQKFFNNQGWHYHMELLTTSESIDQWTNYCQKDYKLMGEHDYLEMIECNDIRWGLGFQPTRPKARIINSNEFTTLLSFD